MPQRSEEYPVARNKDGSVSPARRAAGLKEAVRIYTQEDTVGLTATWRKEDDRAYWALVFTDE